MAASSFTTSISTTTPSPPSMATNNAEAYPVPYSFNSRIMVAAIAVLFIVIFFVLCLHVYAKWFWKHHASLLSSRRIVSVQRQPHEQEEEGQQYYYLATMAESLLRDGGRQGCGLEREVREALPTFCYEGGPKEEEEEGGGGNGGERECAVCLSEFKKEEKGRLLPACGHFFHTDCIDMWFHSHSTCPLCRTPVTGSPFQKMEAAAADLDEEQEGGGADATASASSAAPSSLSSPSSSSSSSLSCSCSSLPVLAHSSAPSADAMESQALPAASSSSSSSNSSRRSLSQVSIDRYLRRQQQQRGAGGGMAMEVSRCLSFSCLSRLPSECSLSADEEAAAASPQPHKSYSFRISIKRLLSMERSRRGWGSISSSSSRICPSPLDHHHDPEACTSTTSASFLP